MDDDNSKTSIKVSEKSAITIEEIKGKTAPILSKNDVSYAGVFGSHIHGTAREDSDIDLLVEFSQSKSLLDVVGIQQELSEQLGRKVDLVTKRSLSKYFRDDVLREVQTIYGQR